MRMRQGCATGLAVVALGITCDAQGAGFALKEQSTTAQGNAFAGATAGADDISYMFFNPAALARHDGAQVQSMVTYIRPQVRAEGATATTVVGNTIEGGTNSGEIAPNVFLPALYASWQARNDLRFGLGINAPFGLSTENPDDWVGRYHGTRSELKTININPAVAWSPNPYLALGAGIQVQYAEATLENAVDFGTIAAIPPISGGLGGTPGSLADDGSAKVEGNDWSAGFNVGVLVMPTKRTRFGAAYRSAIKHRIEGDAEFDTGTGVGPAVSAATGLFVDTGAQADITLPAMASFGVHHDLTDEWGVMGEVQWTNWATFDELVIEFDNAQPDNVTTEKWNDSFFVALGTTYRPKDTGLTFRLGVAHDQTPVEGSFRTPRIPDASRTWLSAGVGYRVRDHIDLQASYTRIWVGDADIDLAANGENGVRGNLTTRYESSIDLIGVSARIKF